MIDRYIRYLAAIRRYSPRTCELYRSVLEDFFAFASESSNPETISGIPVSDGLSPESSRSARPHRGASLAVPPLTMPRVARIPETAAAGHPPDAAACLDIQTIRSYEVHLLDGKGESAKTVNLHLSVLSGFCKFLMKEGVLAGNPVRLVSRPKQEKRLPLFYREDAMRAYFEQTKGVLEYGKYEDCLRRMILGLLYGTGLRRAELISLNRESVDLSRRVLRVRGKGDKIREIPLLPSLCEEILLYLQAVGSLKCADTAPEAPLLQTPRGARLYPVYVDRAVKAALGEVGGISGRKSPHVLRHTLATELLDGGADLNSIKELLGHSSLAATQVYTHNSIERLQSVYKSAHPRAKNDGNYGD